MENATANKNVHITSIQNNIDVAHIHNLSRIRPHTCTLQKQTKLMKELAIELMVTSGRRLKSVF